MARYSIDAVAYSVWTGHLFPGQWSASPFVFHSSSAPCSCCNRKSSLEMPLCHHNQPSQSAKAWRALTQCWMQNCKQQQAHLQYPARLKSCYASFCILCTATVPSHRTFWKVFRLLALPLAAPDKSAVRRYCLCFVSPGIPGFLISTTALGVSIVLYCSLFSITFT